MAGVVNMPDTVVAGGVSTASVVGPLLAAW
jgi:hypothetical protein